MHLRTSLAYPIIGFVVLSVFGTAMIMHYSGSRAIQENMLATDWAQSKRHHDFIRGYIGSETKTMSELAKIYKSYDAIIARTAVFFNSGGFEGKADRIALKATLNNLGLWNHIDDILITDPSGKVIVRARSDKKDDILKGWGVAEALDGQDIVLTTFTDPGWEIRAVSPVRVDGNVACVIVILKRIDDHFAHELSQLFDCDVSFGTLSGIFASTLPPESRSLVDKTLMMKVMREKISARKDFEKTTKTDFYAPLQVVDENFCLIVEKDTSESKRIAIRKNKETLLLSLLISIIISSLGFIFALRLIRPIQKLKKTSQTIAKEIADENLEDIKGNEVDNLVHVFNCMVDTIRRHIAVRQAVEEELQQHQNQLESQVAQRTANLNRVNEELQREIRERISTEKTIMENKAQLSAALLELKQTQSKMIQSEKMASVGQLAAGVAHEINNPAGYVSSNLRTLAGYQEDINKLLREYRALVEQVNTVIKKSDEPGSLSELVGRVIRMETDVEIHFLMDDIPMLVQESLDGIERIRQIVAALKNFAHPGEQEPQDVDINYCLESTLKVVWNELKYKATVTKKYGELPLVNCHPQQINQVFANILVNASHAIETKGEISISTKTDDGFVVILITDTGTGISPKNLTRIFDPFFTTKEVGKGTGLGLHIAYDIIQSHSGRIEIESIENMGTTFLIYLPHVK